jgi:hypothetical protein
MPDTIDHEELNRTGQRGVTYPCELLQSNNWPCNEKRNLAHRVW